MDEAIMMLRQHFEELCVEDLPLYLTMAYRLNKNSSPYQCEKTQTFIFTILEKFETLKPRQMAQAITDFLKRYCMLQNVLI